MSESENIAASTPTFSPEGNVVKSQDYVQWKEGSEYLAAAKEESRRLIAQAQQQAASASKTAYDNAIGQAERESAEKDIAVSALLDEQTRALKSDFVNLIIDTTRKIVGDMSDNDRIAAIATKAYERFRDERQVTVKVHPDVAEHARHSLRAKTGKGAQTESIKIIADPSLTTDDCIIVTRRGITRAGLDAQLDVLHRGLSQQIES